MTTPTSPSADTDVLIVGAGPTGLYGAYYAGFRGLRTTVVDVLPQVGGQVLALYPDKEIHDVAALPAIRGRDFVQALLEQAGAYSPSFVLGRQARRITNRHGHIAMRLDDGTELSTKAVVITAGIGAPTPRPLGCGGEWLGRGLSYFLTDPAEHEGKDVVVVGGGDSALDWADALAGHARSVTLVHRRTAFRGHAATVDRVRRRGVTIHTNSRVVAFAGDLPEGRLRGISAERADGTAFELPAQQVVAALGFVSDLGPLREWGLTLRDRSIVVDRSMRTNLAGVYAAGDVATYPEKVKLMSVGFGEVATAMNHVAVDLDPTLTLFPGHSTDERRPSHDLCDR